MMRAVIIINRGSITIRIEVRNTASIFTNSDTNNGSICLSLASTKAILLPNLDLTGIRVAGKIGLPLESARGTPAVTLDGKLAAVTSVIARRMIVREGLVIYGITVITDDSKAGIISVGVAARES
ncbi:hypothetical protein N7490_009049 [Penicillium lividum]|nr:hypothetical protein N7490_009049 [Penicillium lividum]